MFSRSYVTLHVFIWIGLLNCLLAVTVGWPLSPLYGRRRLLRNEQERRRKTPGEIKTFLRDKPHFGRRITRSVGSVEVDYDDLEQNKQSEGWKRELQG